MPQIISFHTTPEEANGHIAQALALLADHDLTADERASLLPVLVSLLAAKPIGMQPDGPTIDLNALKLGRH